MKLCTLHILEAADKDLDSPTFVKITKRAASGGANAGLALLSIIVHGLLKQSVAVGKIKPKSAAVGIGIDRLNAINKRMRDGGIDPDAQHENQRHRRVVAVSKDNQGKYDELQEKIGELQEVNADLARRVFKRYEHLYLRWRKESKDYDVAEIIQSEVKMLNQVTRVLEQATELANKQQTGDEEQEGGPDGEGGKQEGGLDDDPHNADLELSSVEL